eukprot:COSAG05_NODE_3723_length_1881_cov_3.555805_4_plen_29_part_01
MCPVFPLRFYAQNLDDCYILQNKFIYVTL